MTRSRVGSKYPMRMDMAFSAPIVNAVCLKGIATLCGLNQAALRCPPVQTELLGSRAVTICCANGVLEASNGGQGARVPVRHSATVRCDASIRSRLEAKRTLHERRERLHPTRMAPAETSFNFSMGAFKVGPTPIGGRGLKW